MRRLNSHLAKIIVFVMIMVMVPSYAFGETETLENDSGISFDLGTNYKLTVTEGDFPTLFARGNSYDYFGDLEDVVLESVKSSDKSVVNVSIDDDEDDWVDLKAKAPGKATVTIKDIDGNVSEITVTVKEKKTIKLTKEEKININLGNNYKLTVKAGDEVTFSTDWASPEWESTKSSDKSVAKVTVDEIFSDFIMVKAKKAGETTITLKTSDYSTKIFLTVKPGTPKIESVNWIFKNTKNVKIKAKHVKKGDVIKLKIGKKTYTKKVTKDALETTVKIKIKKPGFYGKKYKLTLTRKGKDVAKESEYVYLSDTVYVGYSKKKVKWLVDWNDPDKKNYSAYSEQWCYDWDGDGLHDAYLYFRNGKVSNWQIYD